MNLILIDPTAASEMAPILTIEPILSGPRPAGEPIQVGEVSIGGLSSFAGIQASNEMPLLPISTVRTSNALTTQRLLFQLNADQLELQRQYDQLSTGRRVLRLSDDPAAAGRAIGLYRGIDRGNQLVRNATSTSSFYQAADDALARVDSALVEARGVAVQAAQTVISEDERAALALTIQQTINSVFAAGNSIFRDHQLLGGFLNSGNALGL